MVDFACFAGVLHMDRRTEISTPICSIVYMHIIRGLPQGPWPRASNILKMALDGSENRPEPNISVIGQSGISVNDSARNHVTCDLCCTILKGQGYLAQHRGKKKCQDKQRTNRDSQLQMEASMARVRSMRLSESECAEGDIGPVDLSKVYKNRSYFPILT